MPTYVVAMRKWQYEAGAVEADGPEEAVDKIIMRSDGNPKDWEILDIQEVRRSATGDVEVVSVSRDHAEPGAISFT